MTKTIPFEEGAVLRYLDSCILFWRRRRDLEKGKEKLKARYRIDTFQAVRMTLFGECLSEDVRWWWREENVK